MVFPSIRNIGWHPINSQTETTNLFVNSNFIPSCKSSKHLDLRIMMSYIENWGWGMEKRTPINLLRREMKTKNMKCVKCITEKDQRV